MKLDYFTGEFMFHPAMLELSMNTCSHNCAYCFATIKKNSRYFKVKPFENSLCKDSLHTYMLKKGYPVVLSNNTDPFAAINFETTKYVTEKLRGIGGRIFWQTKCGKDMLKFTEKQPKELYYITITTDDDKISKRVERGAPCTSERIEIIKGLISQGHTVMVGINPLAKEWLPEERFKPFVEKLSEIGVRSFYIQRLNFSDKEAKEMPEKRSAAMGIEDLLKYSGRRNSRDAIAYAQRMAMWSIPYGGGCGAMPKASSWYKPFIDVYNGKVFPNTSMFITDTIQKYGENEADITFDDFCNSYLSDDIFDMHAGNLDGFLIQSNRNVWRGRPENQKIKTFKQLARIFWNEKQIKSSPINVQLFSVAGKDEKQNVILHYHGGELLKESLV
jgi:DNA repair photolyase